MRRNIVAALAVVALSVPAVVLACPGNETAEKNPAPAAATAQASSIKEVTVPQVAQLQKDKKTTMVDANNDSFRSKNGVIPGATLLTSLEYDPSKELPAAKDQQLIFYCANTHCGASHMAAQKAIDAGYKNVSVMPEGLMGWKNAGQPTSTVKPQS
jgi:rhodanese-related sulfurtransferase